MKEGPGEQMAAAAGRGRFRASRADREQVIDALKAAFVQGRLAKDELDARVGQALASPAKADLVALIADIPAEAIKAQLSRKPRAAAARPPVNMAVIWGASGTIPLAALVTGLPALLPWGLRVPVVALVVIIYETLWVAGFLWLDSRPRQPG